MSRRELPQQFIEDSITLDRIFLKWYLRTLPARAYQAEWTKAQLLAEQEQARRYLSDVAAYTRSSLAAASDDLFERIARHWRSWQPDRREFMRLFPLYEPERFDDTMAALDGLEQEERRIYEDE